jgi:N-acetyltransferase
MNISHNLSLESELVLLRPLSNNDKVDFSALVHENSLWDYFTMELDKPGELERWIQIALQNRTDNIRIPFTIVEKSTGKIAGSTSFGSISFFDKRIEIGWSWLGKELQGSGINFHAKFVLLSYAFEALKFERVEIKTDNLNERSKQALRKIGAREEGVLRSHMQMPKNRRRDSVYFSILKNEWTDIKKTIFANIQQFSYFENEHD